MRRGHNRLPVPAEGHMHIFMNGTDYRQALLDIREGRMEMVVRRHLQQYKDAGITWIRDGGDHFGASVLAALLAPEYGITCRTPIFAIHKADHYGRVVGESFTDMASYEALVDRAISQGADFIKIMISGIMDFDRQGALTEDSLEKEEIHEMIAIAHERGMAVMAHTNGVDGVKAAVKAGVDSLEHGNFMDEECLQLLAKSETVYLPTLVTIGNLLGDDRFPEEGIRSLMDRQREIIRRCVELGVHVGLGSDAGAYRVPHGKGTYDEWELLKSCVDHVEALQENVTRSMAILMEKF